MESRLPTYLVGRLIVRLQATNELHGHPSNYPSIPSTLRDFRREQPSLTLANVAAVILSHAIPIIGLSARDRVSETNAHPTLATPGTGAKRKKAAKASPTITRRPRDVHHKHAIRRPQHAFVGSRRLDGGPAAIIHSRQEPLWEISERPAPNASRLHVS